jgi:glycosyltransferase involved in cell wall biosynthesis
MAATEQMDVAILHPSITSQGGAEQVLWALAGGFEADVYAGYVDAAMVPDGADVTALFGPHTARLSRLSHASDDLIAMLSFQAVEPLWHYDVVIVTKLNATWYVPAPGQRLLWYVHNVPKQLYTHIDDAAGPLRMLGKVVKRQLYMPNLAYPDRFIANSESTARDITQYWGIPPERVTVAHPTGTVRTDVTPTDTAGEYYLYVGRLAEGKGLPALVTAATRTGTRLIICGRGPLRASLEAAAGERITFRGYVRGEPKLRLLREARAFINPSHIESFGITTVEALLCGTP